MPTKALLIRGRERSSISPKDVPLVAGTSYQVSSPSATSATT